LRPRGTDVVEVHERIGRQFGYSKAIRVDQGTELVSRDLDLWAYHRDVTLDFLWACKPTDNAFIESFNGKFRAECLNAHRFTSLTMHAENARLGVETTMRNDRTAMGNKTPIALAQRSE
jgi:putative transposase